MLDILPQHAFLAVTLMQLQLNLRANIYEFIYHFIIIFFFTHIVTYHYIILLIPVDKCIFDPCAPVVACIANIHEHEQILVLSK